MSLGMFVLIGAVVLIAAIIGLLWAMRPGCGLPTHFGH